MLRGWSHHLLFHPSPLPAPLPVLLLVQLGWCHSPPCVGLADSSSFSNEWYKGWITVPPGLPGSDAVHGRSPAALVQWAAGCIPHHPAFQDSSSNRPWSC